MGTGTLKMFKRQLFKRQVKSEEKRQYFERANSSKTFFKILNIEIPNDVKIFLFCILSQFSDAYCMKLYYKNTEKVEQFRLLKKIFTSGSKSIKINIVY